MQYLKAALQSIYDGDAVLQIDLKKLYFVNKAASGQRPFGLISPIQGSHMYSSHNRIDWLPIEFKIEARSENSLLTAVESVYTAYDNAVLPYDGSDYVHVSIRRVDFDGPHEESGVWTFTIYYIIQRAKALA